MTKKFTTVQSFDFLNNKKITSSVINSYKNDGVICLRGAVSNHWLKIMLHPTAKIGLIVSRN